jgi:hypothetical protein
VCHTLPTGAAPIATKDGKLEQAAWWEFDCEGWNHNDDLVADGSFQSGARRLKKLLF